jgi:hypothetical protein
MPFFLASGERDVLVPIEKVRLLPTAQGPAEVPAP